MIIMICIMINASISCYITYAMNPARSAQQRRPLLADALRALHNLAGGERLCTMKYYTIPMLCYAMLYYIIVYLC